MKTIAIVDYGMGNLMSVKKALAYVAPNHRVLLTHEKQVLCEADRVVFPGQGAISACMLAIEKHQLANTIKQCAQEKPFLGICLGLQMLFDHCHENNGVEGLGLLAGEVKKLPNKGLKIPQIGWNQVRQTKAHPLWHGIADAARFYTVHSYYALPKDEALIYGSSDYGIVYPCVVAFEHIFAVQFHPEKSQQNGLQLLTNFMQW